MKELYILSSASLMYLFSFEHFNLVQFSWIELQKKDTKRKNTTFLELFFSLKEIKRTNDGNVSVLVIIIIIVVVVATAVVFAILDVVAVFITIALFSYNWWCCCYSVCFCRLPVVGCRLPVVLFCWPSPLTFFRKQYLP